MEIEGNLAKGEANNRLRYWADKIVALGATNIAGVERIYKGGDRYAINLEVYVDKTSPEYLEFISRFL